MNDSYKEFEKANNLPFDFEQKMKSTKVFVSDIFKKKISKSPDMVTQQRTSGNNGRQFNPIEKDSNSRLDFENRNANFSNQFKTDVTKRKLDFKKRTAKSALKEYGQIKSTRINFEEKTHKSKSINSKTDRFANLKFNFASTFSQRPVSFGLKNSTSEKNALVVHKEETTETVPFNKRMNTGIDSKLFDSSSSSQNYNNSIFDSHDKNVSVDFSIIDGIKKTL